MTIQIDDLNEVEREMKEDAIYGNAHGVRNRMLAFQTLLQVAQLRELRAIKRILKEDD